MAHSELPTQHAAWNWTQSEQDSHEGAHWGFTIYAGVIHQDDLFEENGRGGVKDTVYRP